MPRDGPGAGGRVQAGGVLRGGGRTAEAAFPATQGDATDHPRAGGGRGPAPGVGPDNVLRKLQCTMHVDYRAPGGRQGQTDPAVSHLG